MPNAAGLSAGAAADFEWKATRRWMITTLRCDVGGNKTY